MFALTALPLVVHQADPKADSRPAHPRSSESPWTSSGQPSMVVPGTGTPTDPFVVPDNCCPLVTPRCDPADGSPVNVVTDPDYLTHLLETHLAQQSPSTELSKTQRLKLNRSIEEKRRNQITITRDYAAKGLDAAVVIAASNICLSLSVLCLSRYDSVKSSLKPFPNRFQSVSGRFGIAYHKNFRDHIFKCGHKAALGPGACGDNHCIRGDELRAFFVFSLHSILCDADSFCFRFYVHTQSF